MQQLVDGTLCSQNTMSRLHFLPEEFAVTVVEVAAPAMIVMESSNSLPYNVATRIWIYLSSLDGTCVLR